jgi:hypothetical protein
VARVGSLTLTPPCLRSDCTSSRLPLCAAHVRFIRYCARARPEETCVASIREPSEDKYCALFERRGSLNVSSALHAVGLLFIIHSRGSSIQASRLLIRHEMAHHFGAGARPTRRAHCGALQRRMGGVPWVNHTQSIGASSCLPHLEDEPGGPNQWGMPTTTPPREREKRERAARRAVNEQDSSLCGGTVVG